jgi:predicted RNase H-like nuclease
LHWSWNSGNKQDKKRKIMKFRKQARQDRVRWHKLQLTCSRMQLECIFRSITSISSALHMASCSSVFRVTNACSGSPRSTNQQYVDAMWCQYITLRLWHAHTKAHFHTCNVAFWIAAALSGGIEV